MAEEEEDRDMETDMAVSVARKGSGPTSSDDDDDGGNGSDSDSSSGSERDWDKIFSHSSCSSRSNSKSSHGDNDRKMPAVDINTPDRTGTSTSTADHSATATATATATDEGKSSSAIAAAGATATSSWTEEDGNDKYLAKLRQEAGNGTSASVDVADADADAVAVAVDVDVSPDNQEAAGAVAGAVAIAYASTEYTDEAVAATAVALAQPPPLSSSPAPDPEHDARMALVSPPRSPSSSSPSPLPAKNQDQDGSSFTGTQAPASLLPPPAPTREDADTDAVVQDTPAPAALPLPSPPEEAVSAILPPPPPDSSKDTATVTATAAGTAEDKAQVVTSMPLWEPSFPHSSNNISAASSSTDDTDNTSKGTSHKPPEETPEEQQQQQQQQQLGEALQQMAHAKQAQGESLQPTSPPSYSAPPPTTFVMENDKIIEADGNNERDTHDDDDENHSVASTSLDSITSAGKPPEMPRIQFHFPPSSRSSMSSSQSQSSSLVAVAAGTAATSTAATSTTASSAASSSIMPPPQDYYTSDKSSDKSLLPVQTVAATLGNGRTNNNETSGMIFPSQLLQQQHEQHQTKNQPYHHSSGALPPPSPASSSQYSSSCDKTTGALPNSNPIMGSAAVVVASTMGTADSSSLLPRSDPFQNQQLSDDRDHNKMNTNTWLTPQPHLHTKPFDGIDWTNMDFQQRQQQHEMWQRQTNSFGGDSESASISLLSKDSSLLTGDYRSSLPSLPQNSSIQRAGSQSPGTLITEGTGNGSLLSRQSSLVRRRRQAEEEEDDGSLLPVRKPSRTNIDLPPPSLSSYPPPPIGESAGVAAAAFRPPPRQEQEEMPPPLQSRPTHSMSDTTGVVGARSPSFGNREKNTAIVTDKRLDSTTVDVGLKTAAAALRPHASTATPRAPQPQQFHPAVAAPPPPPPPPPPPTSKAILNHSNFATTEDLFATAARHQSNTAASPASFHKKSFNQNSKSKKKDKKRDSPPHNTHYPEDHQDPVFEQPQDQISIDMDRFGNSSVAVSTLGSVGAEDQLSRNGNASQLSGSVSQLGTDTEGDDDDDEAYEEESQDQLGEISSTRGRRRRRGGGRHRGGSGGRYSHKRSSGGDKGSRTKKHEKRKGEKQHQDGGHSSSASSSSLTNESGLPRTNYDSDEISAAGKGGTGKGGGLRMEPDQKNGGTKTTPITENRSETKKKKDSMLNKVRRSLSTTAPAAPATMSTTPPIGPKDSFKPLGGDVGTHDHNDDDIEKVLQPQAAIEASENLPENPSSKRIPFAGEEPPPSQPQDREEVENDLTTSTTAKNKRIKRSRERKILYCCGGVILLSFVLVVILLIMTVLLLKSRREEDSGPNPSPAPVVPTPTIAPPEDVFQPTPPPSAPTGINVPPVEPSVPATSTPTMPATSILLNESADRDWIRLTGGSSGETALLLSGATTDSHYGTSVAMSSNGKVVAVGGPTSRQDIGYVQVALWDDVLEQWSPRGRTLTSARQGDEFGTSVDLNEDGTILAVGAIGHDATTGANVGGVFVFEYQSSNGDWIPIGSVLAGTEEDGFFGRTVKLSSDGTVLAVLGASEFEIDSNTSTDNNYVRVFVRDKEGQQWNQVGRNLVSSLGKEIGSTMDLSAAGNVLVIGSPFTGESRGAIHIYQLVNNDWELSVTLVGGVLGDYFGTSVAMTANGAYIAAATAKGWTRVFQFDPIKFGSDFWGPIGDDIETPLVARSATGFPSHFRSSVAITYDDRVGLVILAVGDVFYESFAAIVSPGIVSVYIGEEEKGGGTTTMSWKSVMAEFGGLGDGFGTSTALSKNGHILAIGAPNGGTSSMSLDPSDQTGRIEVLQATSS